MAVNKNFVVKNGLEVNSNLLIADLDSQTVGIGTTIAPHELHVVGGIGVTNLNVTGVATIANLRVTGPSTFVGVATFTDNNVFIQKNLFVNGINITGGSGGSIGTDLVIQRHVRAGGIVTFSDSLFVGSGLGQSTGTLGQVFQVAGVSSDAYIGGTLGIGTTNPQDLALHVVGDTRFVGVNTFQGDVVVTGNLDVTGDITYDEITGRNLNISGLATFQSLTPNRVAIVGAGDTLNDTNSLRFADNDLSQLVLGVGATVGGALTVTGAVDFNSTLDVDGLTELDDVNVSAAMTVAGAVDLNSTLDVDGLTELDDVNVSAAMTVAGAVDINGGLNANTAIVGNLNDNRVVIVGSTKNLEDDANFVFDGQQLILGVGLTVGTAITAASYSVGNNQVISSARQLQNIASLDSTTTATIESAIATPNTFTDIEVTGIATFKSTVNVEDLTPSRVVFVGAGDSLTDDTNFTFDRSQLILGVGATVGGALTVAGATDLNGALDVSGETNFSSGVGIADSIFHIGDDNTQIRFPANDTFTVETAGSEALRIDSSGRLLKGHTSSESMLYTGGIQVQGTNSSTSAITVKSNQADSGGPALVLGKSRGALGGTTVVQSGDQLGSIYFNGADGTDTNTAAAEIRGAVDGTPGSNDMPGRLTFLTTADGASLPTERLRITSDGDVDFKGANGITSMSFDRSSNSLDFVDGAKAQFGTGDDLQIYHNGTNSFITDAGSGHLQIDTNDFRVQNAAANESIITGVENGSVDLYFDNSRKLQTTGAGVTVTGICSASGGFDIGIHSAGTSVAGGPVKILNFVGTGNTFAYDASTDTIDISIAGGGGGGGGGGGVSETDTTVSTVNPTGVGSFATANFRSASVIAQINQLNTDYQVGRYLMIHDGTTVTVIEESAVSTGSTMLGSFTGVIDGSNVELRVTLASAGVSTITTKIDTVTV